MMSDYSKLNPNAKAAISALGAGLGGAVLAQIGHLLARHVLVLTKLMDKIIPLPIQEIMFRAAIPIGRIASLLKDPLVGNGIITDKKYSVYVAPITEEVVYRLILQQGTSTALKNLGVPATIAKTIIVGMIVITNVLFGLAHEADISRERFVSVFLQGTAFGITQTFGGLAAAILAHGISNKIHTMIKV